VKRTDVVIIGGGQAGLAMSRCLSDRGIEHVILERGRVGERWRSERWDSLQLLTPNWQSRLPGFQYSGPDPDGYMTMAELVAYLERYASVIGAPVQAPTIVLGVRQSDGEFVVDTTRARWRARSVVVATGYSDVPHVPRMGTALPRDIFQIVPSRYRNPNDLPSGGVLVVGASATGIQLADEIHASGRPVTIAVGRHTRLPRMYRGRDILWWLDAMGVFDETIDQVFDREISRTQPSLQLIGRDDHASLDLAILRQRGVRAVGRAVAIDGTRVHLDDDLVATTVASDAKLALLLRRIDEFIDATGEPAEPNGDGFVPNWPASMCVTPEMLDLRAERIRSVLWATGFQRSYPWLKVPVLDAAGEIRHVGGVTPIPGLYVLGMHFQRRRKSAFIDGVGADAAEIAEHLSLAFEHGFQRLGAAAAAELRSSSVSAARADTRSRRFVRPYAPCESH
jgi:putative flavoprotein involved in K+ transport